jgi:hypothetical protein
MNQGSDIRVGKATMPVAGLAHKARSQGAHRRRTFSPASALLAVGFGVGAIVPKPLGYPLTFVSQ